MKWSRRRRGDAGGDSLVLGRGRLSGYQGVQSSPVTPGNAVTTTLGSQVAPQADPLLHHHHHQHYYPHTRPLAGTGVLGQP